MPSHRLITRQRSGREAATTRRSSRACLSMTNLLPPVPEGLEEGSAPGLSAVALGFPEEAGGLAGGDLVRDERAALLGALFGSAGIPTASLLVSAGPSLQAGPAR
eukprot:14726900-Heterocapsa_arctica.AAC.1